MFMPGCGGPQQFVNSVFLSFSRRCHSCASLFCFSFISALRCQHCLPLLLLASGLCFLAPHSFFSSSPSCSSSSLLPLLLIPFSAPPPSPLFLSLPRRSHERLVVCLLEGIPTPPPPPLEPLSFLSLFALSHAHCLFPLPFPLSPFFPSSLFNVEVLSNCWLPLWLGGNGIFRRMPHAVASIHS